MDVTISCECMRGRVECKYVNMLDMIYRKSTKKKRGTTSTTKRTGENKLIILYYKCRKRWGIEMKTNGD